MSDRQNQKWTGQAQWINRLYKKVYLPINRLFDKLFGPTLNPLHQSGSLAILFLLILLVTGLYLLFFYNVKTPYQSLTYIHNNLWLGRYVRTLHRLATGAMLFFVFIHCVHMFVHGKSWGKRILAWLSGWVLYIAVLISAWTGYLMIWDRHSVFLLRGLLGTLSQIPGFSTKTLHMMSGATVFNASFYFMLLFLHVAIPLGLIFGIGIHTIKLKNTMWLPNKKTSLVWSGMLMAIAALVQLPLLPKADLLQLGGIVAIDIWSDYWIFFMLFGGSQFTLLVFVIFYGLFLMSPLWTRPKINATPAVSNPDMCTGCKQCMRDCPYDAITMIPKDTKGQYAFVSSDKCVSCGICFASCHQMTIGPFDMTAANHLRQVERWFHDSPHSLEKMTIVCTHATSTQTREQMGSVLEWPCMGTLHMAVLQWLCDRFRKVELVPCSPAQCLKRQALTLFKERIDGTRHPSFVRTPGRTVPIWQAVSTSWGRISKGIAQYAAIGLILSLVGWFTFFPYQIPAQNGQIRVSIHIQDHGILKKAAYDIPVHSSHMKPPTNYQKSMSSYRLTLQINGADGTFESSHIVSPAGFRKDGPLSFYEDLDLRPGSYRIVIHFLPLTDISERPSIRQEQYVDLEAGQVHLIDISSFDNI